MCSAPSGTRGYGPTLWTWAAIFKTVAELRSWEQGQVKMLQYFPTLCKCLFLDSAFIRLLKTFLASWQSWLPVFAYFFIVSVEGQAPRATYSAMFITPHPSPLKVLKMEHCISTSDLQFLFKNGKICQYWAHSSTYQQLPGE